MRLFVALELPDDIKQYAAGVIAQLKQSGADIKWVKPQSMHVTLKFLGEVDQDEADDLALALGEAFYNEPALDLIVAGCGAFPNPRKPNVVWLGLGGETGRLARIASKVEDVCEAHGFARERRPFKAHLTLGRARRGKGPGKNPAPLATALTSMAGEGGPKFKADAAALMQSTLTPQGAIYKPVTKFNLG